MAFLLSISSSRALVWPFGCFHQIKKYDREGKLRGIYSASRCLLWLIRWIHVISQLHERISSINNSWHLGWIKIINPWPVSWTLPTKSCLFHVLIRWWCSTPLLMIVRKPYHLTSLSNPCHRVCARCLSSQESGYIWHTTGSGKTLTSYKVARNLLQIPAIQKTIFVVDRRGPWPADDVVLSFLRR